MKHVAVYVTGSIAAYKAVELVRALQKKGYAVRVAETHDAEQLVGPATFASLTKEEVLSDLWGDSARGRVPHIELADWSDLAVVVPATANMIAKMAQGIADDAVSTALLATSSPVVVVPAMNVHMWGNPATKRNIATLKNDGRLVMDPTTGYLAEGYSGKGRLPAVEQIANFIDAAITAKGKLTGKRVVVTLGGTREPLDPVRFIGNRSSGKMGLAIAQAALNAGAEVTIIAGSIQVQLPDSPRVKIVQALTTEDMATAVAQALPAADVLVMTAAVADFKLAHPANRKLKKKPGQSSYQLTLVPTTDILRMAGMKKRPDQLVIGFAAETDHLLVHAQEKLAQKHADMIIANDVSDAQIGFGSDNNRVTVLRPGHQPDQWPQLTKTAVGQRLVDMISRLSGKED